jgi:DNA-directed RNA polymerase subunit RPC12/RpoP
MQKGQNLQFSCIACREVVSFSIFELDSSQDPIKCVHCKKRYVLDDNNLKRQLRKFEALCRQIVESEEILGHTSVGVDIGNHHVKIPYKLLLTRLNSSIDLMIGDQPVSIIFRLEPALDYSEFIPK